MICKCPLNAALSALPQVACPENFGQIQKVAFQRLSGTSPFSETTIKSEAEWTTRTTAEDDSKIVVSPFIQAPTTEAGAARTFGGGNETLGGIEEVIGREPTSFTGVIRGRSQSIIKVMKELMCEKFNLGVYLFDEHGNVGCLKNESDNLVPIPIRSLFISDKVLGGLEAPDSNNISWSFLPNWSDDLVKVTPDFNPLNLQ